MSGLIGGDLRGVEGQDRISVDVAEMDHLWHYTKLPGTYNGEGREWDKTRSVVE